MHACMAPYNNTAALLSEAAACAILSFLTHALKQILFTFAGS